MENESDAIKWLKEVIKIPTIFSNETQVALVIKRILDDVGIPNFMVPLNGDESRCNLIATLEGTEPGKVLGFAGHMDVVPLGEEEWTFDPFGAEEINGRIYGRGSSDMKGGLMAAVAAMVNIKKNNVPFAGTIKLFATASEETGLQGAKQLTDEGYANDVDAMVVGEPTSGVIYPSHKGVLRLRITADIDLAAGEEPAPGHSAINYLLRYLEKYDEQFNLSDFVEESTGINPPTISLNMIGNRIEIGEDTVGRELKKEAEEEIDLSHWEAILEIRTVPALNQQALREKLIQLMRDMEEEIPGLRMDLDAFVDNAPVSTNRNDSFVKLVSKANGGIAIPSLIDLPGCTDASEFIRLRSEENPLPIVIFARATSTKAHQTDEYINADDYTKCIEVYEKIIKSYLQPDTDKQ